MTTQSILPLAVSYDEYANHVVLIDQRQLPTRLVQINYDSAETVAEAIRDLVVRGAPAIGIAAAYGLAMVAKQHRLSEPDVFTAAIYEAHTILAASRPTAANLFHALNQVLAVVMKEDQAPPDVVAERMLAEARAIHAQDMAIGERIGLYGADLLHDGAVVVTHCNAGALATGNQYGTALAPVYMAARQQKNVQVFACETRPVLQGARLTSFELAFNHIPVTVVCDNMAASVFKKKNPDAVFVGCDRVAANGDMANKIGTYGLAILAAHHGVPFYVCAPTTIDVACPNGDAIPIEERHDDELRTMWYQHNMIADEAKIWNPAFDVTPANLITAYITEHGILKPPFDFKKGF